MEAIKNLLPFIAETIDLIGIVILVIGFIKFLIKYLRLEAKSKLTQTPISGLQVIRCDIGIYVLLALDFLIASDIVNTMTDISQSELIAFAVLVVLRTGIGYFLGKEIQEIHESATNIK